MKTGFIKKIAALSAVSMLWAGAALAETYTLRMGNVVSGEAASGRILTAVAERLNARKDLNLKVEVFNDGVLGDEFSVLDQVSRSSVEGMVAQGVTILQPRDEKFAIEELPFFFPSTHVAHEALDGEYGAMITEEAKKHGFTILAFWENGMRHYTNSRAPIVTPEDTKGLRFRSGQSAVRLDMFAAIGATALPLPFGELFGALQQGLVDGQETPLELITTAGLYNVQKYLSMSGHIYNSAPVIVSTAWFESLPDNVRDAIREEFFKGRLEQRELAGKATLEFKQKLIDNGMQVNDVDRAAFLAVTEKVWKDWEPKIGSDWIAVARKYRGN